jgi:ferredoxin--NADP+ reductase
VGATTRRLCALRAGDEILDVAGPMGSPVELPRGGHVCGIGGGFGTASLLCLMRELRGRGDRTTAVVGARTKDLLILVDELERACDHVEICTDDGSAGFNGLVTQRLARLIAGEGPGRPDHVVAIGPMAMMRAVAETTRGPGVHTLVSMDPLMVDGTGMCGGCRVMVAGEPRFACVDGPCFDGHQVDFEVAMRRNKAYVREERAALERLACASGRA